MSKYAPGYTGAMSTAGANPKKPKTQPTRPTPMPKESLLPKRGTATTPKGMARGGMTAPSRPSATSLTLPMTERGAAKAAAAAAFTPKGMAKGGMTKKGMAKGGMAKKGYK